MTTLRYSLVALCLLAVGLLTHGPSHGRRLTLLDEQETLPPLFPLQPTDYAGLSLATLGLVLAAGGGVGGGGILVPIYILILEFPVKHAIPLASVTVLGGAVANNVLNACKRDRHGRSLIDWDLMLQLEPLTIAGALIGADLNEFLPEIVLVLLLLVLLTLTAQKTWRKAHKLYQQESAALEETKSLVETTPMYGTNGDEENGAESAVFYPWIGDAFKLTSLFVVVTVVNLLKGGPGSGGGPFGSQRCGPECYWIGEIAIVLLNVAFAAGVRQTVLKRPPRSIVWTPENTITYPAYAFVAGLVAGLFGIGGGIVKGPLMLALGVDPTVAAATSACMILYTSSTATASYAVFDLLVYDYAAACLVLGLGATLIGQTIMQWLLQKYQRNSYIAFSIAIVVALSAVGMTLESAIAIWG